MNKFFLLAAAAVLLASCGHNYGDKVTNGHIETYYKDGITKEQAERTARFLYEIDMESGNDTTVEKSTQLTKTGDTVSFRMVVQDAKYKDMFELSAADTSAGGKQLLAQKIGDAEYLFQVIGNIISDSVFSGRPVNVDLTDNRLKTIRTIHYIKTDYTGGGSKPEKYSAGKIDVYTRDMDGETSQKLADFLVTKLGADVAAEFYVSLPENEYITVQIISKKEGAANATEAQLEEMAGDISKAVFLNAGLNLEITDANRNVLKKYTYLPEELRNQPAVDTTVVR
jgi:hypothetical protein